MDAAGPICESDAMATARIVCDFEPGMLTTPDKQDVLAVNIIFLIK